MSLIKYRLKRDFNRTNEPRPNEIKTTKASQRFVIQEHKASALHYDFRMEMKDEGSGQIVLKSWAVPKNIPLLEGEKRLAIETEDHPVNYLNFEGTIPVGNYGAGEVKIWDQGYWGLLKGLLTENKISFNLYGEKIKGRYILLKLNRSSKDKKRDNQWLIWKKGSEFL